MNCLCCGKPIIETASEQEKSSLWHNRCVKRFFGTKTLPDIDVSEEVLEQLAIESTNKGLTVPGVQKKMSLHLDNSRAVASQQQTHALLLPLPMTFRVLFSLLCIFRFC